MRWLAPWIAILLFGCSVFKLPPDPLAQYRRYKVLSELKKDLRMTPSDLEKLQLATELSPRDPEVLEFWAVAMKLEGDLGAAHQMASSIVKQSPEYGPGWRELGLILLEKGEINNGVQCCARALELNPLDILARGCVAKRNYSQLGRARSLLEVILRMN